MDRVTEDVLERITGHLFLEKFLREHLERSSDFSEALKALLEAK